MASKTIQEWCKSRGFSRGFFYILDSQGKAPQTFNVGRRRLISDEDDIEWERARRAESVASKQPEAAAAA